MNKEWIELLAGTKDFDEGEVNKHIATSDNVQAGFMTYRNILLQQMGTPDFNEGITKENLQKWFLEPISEQKFDYIKEDMKTNYWTIEELWDKCREESIGVLSASNLLNEDIKFYDGMRIMHKGHVVNVLDKYDVRQIEFIQEDANFNIKQFLFDLEIDTVPVALSYQQKVISKHRMESITNFELTKENVENLLAKRITNLSYLMLTQSMKITNWTLKELVQESIKTGFNIMMIVGVPNKVMA